MEKLKIAVITGTRPELIKLSVLLRIIQQDPACDLMFIHSGQHYDQEMFAVFLKELELPNIDYNIQVGSHPNSVQTGHLLIKLYEVIKKNHPNIILAQGDTNTVAAAALTAFKNNIPFGHIEAGIRSFDERMPEEINRKIAGVNALFNFAPTNRSVLNLLNEGVLPQRIYNVGNTVVDAVIENKQIAEKKSSIINDLNLTQKKYILLTIHRPANVDKGEILTRILNSITEIQELFIIFPIHPRTKKNMMKFKIWKKFGLKENVEFIDPVGYLDMLQLMDNAYFIVTDSGGLQEESVILKKPCLTLRENTERPETVKIGANRLIGSNSKLIKKYIRKLWNDKNFYSSMIPQTNPFGDGTTSQKILNLIKTQWNKNRLKLQPKIMEKGNLKIKIIKFKEKKAKTVKVLEKEKQIKILEVYSKKGDLLFPNKYLAIKKGMVIKCFQF